MVQKKKSGKGLMMIGRMPTAGVTIYQRQGELVTRVSHSEQKRSNTKSQFVQRQKMRHTMALWKMLSFVETMFTQRRTAYHNFTSLANRLPAVFVPNHGDLANASFLMAGIPVSDGTLPAVRQELGEVDGVPALLFDLVKDDDCYKKKLWFYTAEQKMEHRTPRVRFSRREVEWSELTPVDGRFALVGEEFANQMKGWALVCVMGDRCSPQSIVTRCTYYESFTTEDALQSAAKAYGGLTKESFLNGG